MRDKEQIYRILEDRTRLSRDEIEYRGLQLLVWHIGKAIEGKKAGVLERENGKPYLCQPDLDVLRTIYSFFQQ